MAKGKGRVEFEIGSWGGMVHFRCASCSFDSFDKHEMFTHLMNEHDSEAALEQLLSKESEVKSGTNNVNENGG